MKWLIALALALPLLAEDAIPPKPPTVEELTAQVAVKDQEIGRLQAQLQQTADAYQGCVVSRAQMSQRPALNPQQQQMMRPKPALKDKP